MRILLFDWTDRGHHRRYLRRFVEALVGTAAVSVAVPEGMCSEIIDQPVDLMPLADERPSPGGGARNSNARENRDLAESELDRFEDAVDRAKPDLTVHLYADPILRRLVQRRPLETRIALCLFFFRAHYPLAYGDLLPPGETARALFQAWLVRQWRRRADAHSLLLMDEVATHTLAGGKGAPAYWLPEPPVPRMATVPSWEERTGCVLFGSLADRKGIDRLALASEKGLAGRRVVLAGGVEKGYGPQLERKVSRMRTAGVDVEVRDRWHREEDGLRVLAEARCAVLPYPRHYGMSRVLLEATSVGTPVVVEDFGLLGHLVAEHGIGRAIDTSDPDALARAVVAYDEAPADESLARCLESFAERYSSRSFFRAVSDALGLAVAPAAGASEESDRPPRLRLGEPASERERGARKGGLTS